jgi:hypothetical protein
MSGEKFGNTPLSEQCVSAREDDSMTIPAAEDAELSDVELRLRARRTA